MKPWILLERAPISEEGKEICLYQHDADFSIKVGGVELMNSRMHGSEEALARLACQETAQLPRQQILIGGLGMGFTLRAALDELPGLSQVVVAELIPAVVKWNQGVLAALASSPLEDKRVTIHEADVGTMIREGRGLYSAILLDVDNGPESLFTKANDRLYSLKGLHAARAALRRQGVLAVWSAGPDAGFVQRLRSVGFDVAEVRVNARSGPKAGGHHWIWLARK
ncbi:MAG: hypothetical protein KBC91_02900 [Candidatus Omnitrophica bacterium]|nr:hypothetical protein [Candidatus Omnitrophota bacterium]